MTPSTPWITGFAGMALEGRGDRRVIGIDAIDACAESEIDLHNYLSAG